MAARLHPHHKVNPMPPLVRHTRVSNQDNPMLLLALPIQVNSKLLHKDTPDNSNTLDSSHTPDNNHTLDNSNFLDNNHTLDSSRHMYKISPALHHCLFLCFLSEYLGF